MDDRRVYFAKKLPMYDCKEIVLCKLHDYELCVIRNSNRIKEKTR